MSATPQDVLEGRAQWCVICADNAEVLPTLPAKSVAHVITDPPYSEHVHSKTRRGASLPDTEGGESHGSVVGGACFSRSSDLGFAALAEGQREAMAVEFARLVQRWVLAFTDQEGAHPWMTANIAAGLQHIRIGQWVKLNATPQFTGDRPATGCEAIVIAHPKGRKRWNGGGTHALWSFGVEQGERLHTTQKPLDLMLRLVELFTDPGDLILDPFCGSGTTGQAALRLGRRFIGIEADARYAAVAQARLEGGARVESLRDVRHGQRGLFEVAP